MKKWYKQKTTWTALAGMFATTGAYFAGEVELSNAIQLVFAGLVTIFLRQGIEGGKKEK